MQFPLTLEFNKVALSPQISVLDANGNLMFYVKQKLFKLKEAITVFADREQTQPLYSINADRVIDFSAHYHFKDSNGIAIGSIKRNGRRSIWKARYDIFDSNEQPIMRIEEQDAWAKVLDGLFTEIPIVGMFGGDFFNPVYLVERPDDSLALKVSKNKAFFESSFTITQESPLTEQEQLQTVLGVLMMTLVERSRG